jgi:hypothetical protein
MSRLSYDSVDVLIYDPVSANRTATRATLYALGFRRTESVSTIEAFVESMQKNPPLSSSSSLPGRRRPA